MYRTDGAVGPMMGGGSGDQARQGANWSKLAIDQRGPTAGARPEARSNVGPVEPPPAERLHAE
jgi:hypothetical protein